MKTYFRQSIKLESNHQLKHSVLEGYMVANMGDLSKSVALWNRSRGMALFYETLDLTAAVSHDSSS